MNRSHLVLLSSLTSSSSRALGCCCGAEDISCHSLSGANAIPLESRGEWHKGAVLFRGIWLNLQTHSAKFVPSRLEQALRCASTISTSVYVVSAAWREIARQKAALFCSDPALNLRKFWWWCGFETESAISQSTIRAAAWSSRLHLCASNAALISASASSSIGWCEPNCILHDSQMPMAIGVRFTILRLGLGMVSPFRPAYWRLGSPRGLVPFSGSALDGELLSSPVDRLAVVTCRLWYASLTCRQFPTGRET